MFMSLNHSYRILHSWIHNNMKTPIRQIQPDSCTNNSVYTAQICTSLSKMIGGNNTVRSK